MPQMLAANYLSSPLHVVVFLTLAVGIGTALWVPMALVRRFRTPRCASIVIGSVVVVLGLILASAPARPSRASTAVAPELLDHPSVSPPPTPSPDVVSGPAQQKPPHQASTSSPPPPLYTDELQSPTVDEDNAFSIQFPRGWTSGPINGQPWILEATEPGQAFISVGVQAMPGEPLPIAVTRAGVERHLRGQPETTVHASGTDTIQGHPYVWFKYTAPMPTTTGSPRMTMVHNIIPLKSRAFEIRLAAAPDQFAAFQPIMNRSVESFLIRESSVADAPGTN